MFRGRLLHSAIRNPHSAIAIACLCLSAVAAGERYEPSWASLDKRPCPAWFAEARFGIFIHWGVYAVPGWAPRGQYAEWYWNHMQDKDGPTWKHHVATYGEKFGYEQFAPMFKAERFNPDEWADLFARSGARYVVLTSKHHDGYCLWPAPDSKGWNSVDAGPRRDLLGDLAKAVRKAGLKMGFYYSLYEWYNPVYRSDVRRYVDEHMIPQFKDAVTRYAPSIIFSDGEWDHPDKVWRSEELLAWLFNESPCRDEVVVDDRWGKDTRGKHGSYFTSEYGGPGGRIGAQCNWEECQGIGASFGYNRNEGPNDYKTTQQCIRLLVNCVSNGGNLLLGIGPDADGTIPQIMQDRLLEMGKWLKVNGESIYGASAGPLPQPPWGRCTAKPGRLYLHVYEWPKGDLVVPGLKAQITDAFLLSDPGRRSLLLGGTQDGEIAIAVPRAAPDPADTVIVLKVEGEVRVASGRTTSQAADGTIALKAADAIVHGEQARYESGGGKDNIGYWTDPSDWVSWPFELKQPATFDVEITYACTRGSGGSDYAVAVGDQAVSGKVKDTGSWTRFITEKFGTVKLGKAGAFTLSVKPKSKASVAVMNLKSITLRPTKE